MVEEAKRAMIRNHVVPVSSAHDFNRVGRIPHRHVGTLASATIVFELSVEAILFPWLLSGHESVRV
jgi:hypothetical protein